MAELTILHNPRCSTSRAVLTAIEEAGLEAQVVRYLDTPLLEPALLDLLDLLECSASDLVRRDWTFTELGLSEEDVQSKEQVAAVLADNPKLMQRPVLITDDAAIIGRPKDRVQTFLHKLLG